MKTTVDSVLWISIIILSFAELVPCQQEGPGRPVAILRTNARASIQCTETDNGPKCADCNTILTCAGSYEVNSQPCRTLNSLKPYCNINLNTCVNQLDESETCQTNDFLCTGKGIFPDPTNCRMYYICGGKNSPALAAYECPPNLVYDSKNGLCKRSICQNIDCSRNANKYVIYNADPSVMVYCLSANSQQSYYVFRCADSVNMVYSSSTFQCVFKCPKEGRFADRELCTRYYECYFGVGGYRYIRQSCPAGFGFDPKTLVCVEETTCVNLASGEEITTAIS